MKNSFLVFALAAFIIVFASLSGCATMEESTDSEDSPSTEDADSAAVETQPVNDLQNLLTLNRSQLSDVHIARQHDMPESYLKKKENNEAINSNPEDGFRVQILSTRDVELADSVAMEFKVWADTTINGYSAQSYVSFNQPYFRVHVGDFQQRQKANSFSKLVKNQYPDAWVVHDRIEPEHIPADTTTFSIMSEEERKKKESRLKGSETDSLNQL